MSLVYLKNKKNNSTYVYECKSFWNKEKKRPDSIRRCIGKLDPTTNQIILSQREQATRRMEAQISSQSKHVGNPEAIAEIKTVGASILFDHICKKTDLAATLRKSFPDNWQIILSLAYFQAAEGKPLSRIENWSSTHSHPYGAFIDNRRVSELLPTITEDKQLGFFKHWAQKRMEQEYLAYDITSISSYSESNNQVRYGYNRDGEALPQINLAMLFGEKTRLPVFYNSLPGSIKDVSTLHNFLEMTSFLKIGKLHLVMDKGFYSSKNVDELILKRIKFTIALPFSCDYAKKHVERVRETITDHQNFTNVNGQNLFYTTTLTKWDQKKRVYVHVFYNASAAAADYEIFLNRMRQWESEIKSKKLVESHQKYYDKYFAIKETPKRGKQISYKQQAIDEYKKNAAGYLVLLTNDIKDPVEALKIYRAKDVVEKAFDNLKNCLDSKRLRVHMEENMRGRLFIQFIALILISYIHRVMSENDLFRGSSFSELIEELDLLRCVKFSGQDGKISSELTKKQREIAAAFSIDLKTYV